ncbi:tetratricopeptide repeat protein [Dysgonomonas macrotermitis]|uniref:Tetratricopeptide repeat-containing protein n=1 Tax=Dysgonomonas macrotermitis TaxID=1346286 RepID=A0A1M5BF51_9BACT|nr:tetratricopeptide repeat protein [Dysgonomonas macrotermitis]SHF41035.1 Tetratricopeptide repeat-containing protein [Dysgonomonas macrotermitis]
MRKILLIIVLAGNVLTGLYGQESEKTVDYYVENYQFQKALDEISKYPDSKELNLKRVICYKALNRYSEAIHVLSRLETDYPDDKHIKIELARCYQALSDWDKSLLYYNILVEKDSVNIYYRIQRADLLMKQERFVDALSEYNHLINNYGVDNMLSRSALCYERLNNQDSAKVYYAKAWGRDSSDVFSVSSLINLNIKTGKQTFKDAIQLSELYVKRDSTNKQVNVLNALSYYAADAYEEAVTRFSRCYSSGDSSLVVLRSLGLSYYSLGDRDNSYYFLQKAYKKDSTNINVLYALGVTANEKQNYRLGTECFETLIERVIPADFTLYQYYRNLAIAYEGQKKYQQAVDNYRKAVEYANDNQRMYLYYTIVSIYDVDLKLPQESLEYYGLYKQSLQSYYEGLFSKEQTKEIQQEINITKTKLDALDKHIARLKKSLGLADNKKKVIVSTVQINL